MTAKKKHQAPSTKLQRSSKLQCTCCCLKFGASLELGAWCLVLVLAIGCTPAGPRALLEGLLRLGAAQWRLHQLNPVEKTELNAAEKSFSDALRLNGKSAEALNGLGLVRCQRGRAAEGAQLFASALKQQSSYAPALLN